MLEPRGESAPRPRGNPWSATAIGGGKDNLVKSSLCKVRLTLRSDLRIPKVILHSLIFCPFEVSTQKTNYTVQDPVSTSQQKLQSLDQIQSHSITTWTKNRPESYNPCHTSVPIRYQLRTGGPACPQLLDHRYERWTKRVHTIRGKHILKQRPSLVTNDIKNGSE